jgi:cation-transporting ATPase 13A2
MMTKYECPVELRIANNKFVTIRSIDLVPGDVIKVPSNILLPCDCILLSGSAIINEAILTGESIPVIKTSLPNN